MMSVWVRRILQLTLVMAMVGGCSDTAENLPEPETDKDGGSAAALAERRGRESVTGHYRAAMTLFVSASEQLSEANVVRRADQTRLLPLSQIETDP